MSKDDDERRWNQPTAAAGAGSPPAGAPHSVDETVQVEIGVRLKAYYDTITREAVPDRFMELLGELDGVEAGKPRDTKTDDQV